MGRTDTHSGQTAALQRCRDFGHPGRQIQPGCYQMTLHPSLNDTNQISGGKSLQRKIDDFFFFLKTRRIAQGEVNRLTSSNVREFGAYVGHSLS